MWILVTVVIIVLSVALISVVNRTIGRARSRRCPEGRGLYPECLYIVTISDDQFTVTLPDKSVARLPIRQLREVVVETNDSGPWGADVWWRLFGPDAEARCCFPGGATGESEVLKVLQALPGFDNDALIRAMGSTSNRTFTLYRVPS